MPLGRGVIAIAVAGVAFSAIAQQFGGDSSGPKTTPDASTAAGPSPAPTPPPGALAQTQQASPQPQVDESALRYFAAQGDTRRVDAEIARLRALYPNWSPPTDL